MLAYSPPLAGWPAQVNSQHHQPLGRVSMLAVLTTEPTVVQNSLFSSLAMAATIISIHFTISRRVEG